MLTRAASAFLLVLLVAGCADANPSADSAAAPAPSASASDVIDLPLPSTEPSAGKPAAGGAQTITGKVTAGVEPNCLLLQDAGKSYLLVFDDPAMRDDAPVGQTVTLVGRSEPGTMSTCQQGTPFIVSSVQGG